MPGWLSFDPGIKTFSGTAPDVSQSTATIMSATSDEGSTSLEAFRIYPQAVIPFMENQAPDQRLTAGAAFSFALLDPVFFDPAGGTTMLSARTTDLSALPPWLAFNAATDTFSGTAPQDPGILGVRLDATTPSGGTAAEAFHIYTSR